MIYKLNNFTHKSFEGYTNPGDLLFRKKNNFFGYNGKGKSSLAIGIKEEFLKNTKKKTENYRLFNRDYISNSLLLENMSKEERSNRTYHFQITNSHLPKLPHIPLSPS